MTPPRFPLTAACAAALLFGVLAAAGADTGPAPDADGGGAAGAEGRYLTGQLLVASPSMGDPRFTETVILLVKHDAHGAMGLVVNRVIGAGPIGDLLKGFGIDRPEATREIPIHYGGPVEPYLGFVLHSTDYADEATVKVNDSVALTTEVKILEAISRGKGPAQSLFALGYAGWGPGQLEGELSEDAWYVAPPDTSLVFDSDIETKWKRAVASSVIDL